MELVDKTKPGHRRFIAIWLIDPLNRVVNTANVPPQQAEWWMESAFGVVNERNAHKIPPAISQLVLEKFPGHPGLEAALTRGQGGLPPQEILDMVRKELEDVLPMTIDEAEEHRLQLMKERATKVEEENKI